MKIKVGNKDGNRTKFMKMLPINSILQCLSVPKSMKTLLAILTTLLLVQLCPAQNNALPLHFNFLSIKDGMPEGQVNYLLQDRAGYLWIATERGLVRYDGYSTKVYY